jgi:hypothetical protein
MTGVRTIVLVGVLAVGMAVGSAITSFASSGNTSAIPMDDDHPEIHHALHSLHDARDALSNAAHDYHGHRDAAIGQVDSAIHECEICLSF